MVTDIIFTYDWINTARLYEASVPANTFKEIFLYLPMICDIQLNEIEL